MLIFVFTRITDSQDRNTRYHGHKPKHFTLKMYPSFSLLRPKAVPLILKNYNHGKVNMTAQARKDKDTLWENIKALFYAILLAVLIRTLWLQPFHIPSGSMIPTLLIGDNLFVSKTAYGYSRYSIPFGGTINYFSGRIWSAEPKQGEVAVFRSVIEPD